MTTPSKVAGSAAGGNQASGASIVVVPGKTVTPGNLMLVCAGGAGASGLTVPTGWTSFFNAVANSRSQCVAYKVAGSSEPANYTFTSGNPGAPSSWCYLEYQNVNTSSLPDGTAANTSGSSATVSWGSTSPANTNDLWVLATVAYFSTAATWAPASGFATESSIQPGAASTSCLIDDKAITASGATGTASAVQSHAAQYQATSFCLAGSGGGSIALAALGTAAAKGSAGGGYSTALLARGSAQSQGKAGSGYSASLAARGTAQTAGRGTVSFATALAARGTAITAGRAFTGNVAALTARGSAVARGVAQAAVSVALSARSAAMSKGGAALGAPAVHLFARGIATAFGRAGGAYAVEISAKGFAAAWGRLFSGSVANTSGAILLISDAGVFKATISDTAIYAVVAADAAVWKVSIGDAL